MCLVVAHETRNQLAYQVKLGLITAVYLRNQSCKEVENAVKSLNV